MTIVYSWNIVSLKVAPIEDGNINVVNEIYWQRVLTQGESSVEGNGSTPVPYNPENPFIPYNDLTEEIVVQWIEELIPTAALENIDATLKVSLQQVTNPEIYFPPLPWKEEV